MAALREEYLAALPGKLEELGSFLKTADQSAEDIRQNVAPNDGVPNDRDCLRLGDDRADHDDRRGHDRRHRGKPERKRGQARAESRKAGYEAACQGARHMRCMAH